MSLTQAKRFTLEEYHRLGEIGFFHEDDRIELIRGEIIQITTKMLKPRFMLKLVFLIIGFSTCSIIGWKYAANHPN